MAKKKATKKKKAEPAKGKAKPQGPRSEPLPGMGQVTNRRLNNLCEAIGQERDTMNTARKEEQGLIAAALTEMHDKGLTVYKFAGVELTRVPGSEKLRVRVVKDTGNAEVETGRTTSDNADDSEASDLGDGD
jgi:hypothetical protein